MIKVALLVLVAIALAEAYPSGYAGYGARGYGAPLLNEGAVNHYQARRQLYVNEVARRQGSGIGAADIYGVPGVPGTDKGYNAYGRFGAYFY